MSNFFELLQTFRETTFAMPAEHPARQSLQAIQNAIEADLLFLSSVQRLYPQALMQTVVNSPKESPIIKTERYSNAIEMLCESWLRYNTELSRPWLRLLRGGRSLRLGEHLREFPGPIRAIAISAAANQLAIASDRRIYVEELATRNPLFVLDGHKSASADRCKDIWSMEYTPDGNALVSTAERICVWDTTNGSLITQIAEPSRQITRTAVSPTGKRVARSAGDVSEFDIDTGEQLRTLSRGEVVAYAPTRPYIAIGTSSGTVRILDSATGEVARILPAHSGWVCALAFSPCGLYLVSGSWDWTASVWDLERMEKVAAFKDHGGSVESVAFAEDSRSVITASNDGKVRRWSLSTSALLDSYTHKAEVRTVAVSEGNSCIYSGGEDRCLISIPFNDINNAKTWHLKPSHDSRIVHLTTYPAGRLFATTSGDEVAIWHTGRGERISVHKWRESMFGKFFWSKFSPNGEFLVAATSGGNMLGINRLTGEEQHLTACFDEDGAIEMEFSSNSQFFLISAHKELRLFRTSDWYNILCLEGRSPEGAQMGVRYERFIWVANDGLSFGTSGKTWSRTTSDVPWVGVRLDEATREVDASLASGGPNDQLESAAARSVQEVISDEMGLRINLDRPLWLSESPSHFATIDDTVICVRDDSVAVYRIESY